MLFIKYLFYTEIGHHWHMFQVFVIHKSKIFLFVSLASHKLIYKFEALFKIYLGYLLLNFQDGIEFILMVLHRVYKSNSKLFGENSF